MEKPKQMVIGKEKQMETPMVILMRKDFAMDLLMD
jgi:hypothetical protein